MDFQKNVFKYHQSHKRGFLRDYYSNEGVFLRATNVDLLGDIIQGLPETQT